MTKINPRDNKLYFGRGVASRIKGNTKIPVEFIEYNDPSCGSYIDARGFLVLPNFDSASGDEIGKRAMYFVDGSPVYSTVPQAIAALCGYAENEIVASPTPTPTKTVTPTVTKTPSVTPTITVTPSITPTVTATVTVTPSITPSVTVTPSGA